MIGDRHYQNDVAMLKGKGSSKELVSVQRGDLVSGRFRVTSISEGEVAMVDTSLNIKHTIPFSSSDKTAGSSGSGGPASPNDIRQFPRGRVLQPPLQPSLQPSDPGTSIPGIPDNIPRYQPPGQPQGKEDVDDDEDGKP